MKKNFQLSRGFTLVELLVVIAIIGILTSVVLASLGRAKTKASDTKVKLNLVNMRTQVEDYYDSFGMTYGIFALGTCPMVATPGSIFNSSVIINALNSALLEGGGGAQCVAAGSTYAIAVGMKSPGVTWCVDSSGHSAQFTGTPAAAITGTACN